MVLIYREQLTTVEVICVDLRRGVASSQMWSFSPRLQKLIEDEPPAAVVIYAPPEDMLLRGMSGIFRSVLKHCDTTPIVVLDASSFLIKMITTLQVVFRGTDRPIYYVSSLAEVERALHGSQATGR